MVRRLLLAVPVVVIFIATGLIFMAARAPRTWAAHWSSPATVAVGAGQNEYGAVPRGPGRWDLLWVDDDTQQIVFTPATDRGTQPRPLVLDHGDVAQPTLLRSGRYETGAWIRNRNGATDLMAAILPPSGRPRVVRLLDSPQPIEHPYLFAGGPHSVDLVFSWQRYGNFDLFLVSLPVGESRLRLLKRLNRSESYSFYPRAVSDRAGNIHLLHLENCCKQQVWNVSYDRYDQQGRHLGPTRVLYAITGMGEGHPLPSQWAEAILTDAHGAVWGAFAGDGGASVFKASAAGDILEGPKLLDPSLELPQSLALVAGQGGGYLFWDQPFELGRFLDVRRFDSSLAPRGAVERVVYESASQVNLHATAAGSGAEVIWQAVTGGSRSKFEMSEYRQSVSASLAQRLGLGLGNPWFDLILLLIGAVGVAALSTVGNILTIFGLAAVGLIALRILRPIPGRWVIFAGLLSAALYAIFVAPGGPVLFLNTLPSMGVDAVPFGLVAAAGALAFTTWMGTVALRRVEEFYRAGMMITLGVYFFAFVESIIFVQQRLGFI